MRNRIWLTAGVLALALVAHAAGGETRQHFVVAKRDKSPAFEVTRIFHQNDHQAVTSLLIADVAGPMMRVEMKSDYANRKTVASYTLLRGSRGHVRITLDLPYASTTRDGRREELRRRPELANAPVPVSIEANAESVHGLDSDWRSANAPQRAKARTIMAADLLAALRSIRELAGLPPFTEVNASLGYILDPGTLVYRSESLMVAQTRPDCTFDAKLGVPCQP
jgi:hypothetical protein